MENMEVMLTDDVVLLKLATDESATGDGSIVDVGNFRRVQGLIEVIYLKSSGGTPANVDFKIESAMDKEFSTRTTMDCTLTTDEGNTLKVFNIADDDSPNPMFRYLRWGVYTQAGIAADIQFRIKLLLKR